MTSVELDSERLTRMNVLLKDLLESNKEILRSIKSPKADSYEEYLTAQEAADYIGVGYQHFMNRYRKIYSIPEYRKGRLVLFKVSDIKKAIEPYKHATVE
jgi:hypothetical protein